MSQQSDFGLCDRIESGSDREELELIASRLEKGHGPARLTVLKGLDPSDYLSAITLAGLGAAPYAGPSLVQARPTRPNLHWTATEVTLAEVFPRASRPRRLALSAGLLQILDFWEDSHEAAQEADDLGEHTFSPYWHAIAHRRQPDPANAGYWFRRVGRHPIFVELAESLASICEAHGDSLLSTQLLSQGAWNPIGFVSFCVEASRQPGSEKERLARRLQRGEMLRLLDATASALA